jgi:urease accessory protein UreH
LFDRLIGLPARRIGLLDRRGAELIDDHSSNQLPDYPITQLPDSRVPGVIGRRARLEIEFDTRRGRTVIAHAYAEPPFRIGAFDLDDAAYVIVVCSGPGVFAGDALCQSIRVRSGAHAVMTSQSALQVHPGPAAPAAVRHEYRLDPDAELFCHWDPVIPFAGASISQQFEIDADATSRLYWSDAVMAGRLSRGEAWQFETLAHELRLRVGGALTYLERYRVAPGDRAPTAAWIAGDAGYFATAIVKHARAGGDAAEALHRRFEGLANARVAADAIEPGLLVARTTASNGATFARVRAAIRRFAAESIFERPNLVGRK